MKLKIVAGGLALWLAGSCLLPAVPAAAYLAEDNFAPCWSTTRSNPEQSPAVSHPAGYRVRPGDTLWGLARRWGVEPAAIAAANGIDEEAVLQPGQALAIPPGKGLVYRVAEGETLWALSRRFQVSLARLIAANRISDPGSLTAGMELVIPGRTEAAGAKDSPEESSRGLIEKLAWPLVGALTSLFGPRFGEFHHGLDIAGDYGDLVRAAAPGEVSSVGYRPYYGKTVVLDHGNGEETLYGHLEEYLVAAGDRVSEGQPLARVGATGRATGPHLHFEVRLNGRAVNPLSHLK